MSSQLLFLPSSIFAKPYASPDRWKGKITVKSWNRIAAPASHISWLIQSASSLSQIHVFKNESWEEDRKITRQGDEKKNPSLVQSSMLSLLLWRLLLIIQTTLPILSLCLLLKLIPVLSLARIIITPLFTRLRASIAIKITVFIA